MIELKNITKVYKSKKGPSTEALKGINLEFGNNGMTFILGKSGSGKSTLLNILGGLDTYSSGDLIINGKSSVDFKSKDWDSYRNTYIGFVFQEFNLLDNYTVEENIKLSLELQHIKPTKEEILASLRQVGLEDVLKRKPNELSGGQKQRIAIARALIKNPEIILADEPTGNVDSETSSQIFDILKKLSKEKLIVVVSHDEASAKKYADRIIKISDGNIESDKGKKNITENNNMNLISAKLPFIYSLKMGLGNLFHKKIRLIFSSLLIIACLICFGLMTSTLRTNIEDEYINLFKENNNTEVSIVKFDRYISYEKIMAEQMTHVFDENYDWEEAYPKVVEMTDAEKQKIKTNTGLNWRQEYSLENDFMTTMWVYSSEYNENIPIYYYAGNYTQISLVEYENEETIKLLGRAPINDDEIVITSYIADQIIYKGIESKTDITKSKSAKYQPTSYEQIINDNIYINFGNFKYVKIVGIIDYTDYINNNYKLLKETKETTMWDMDFNSEEYKELDALYMELNDDNYKKFARVYVTNSFINNLKQTETNLTNTPTKIINNNNELVNIERFGYLTKETEIYQKNKKTKITTLNSNEIIINETTLNLITDNDYQKKLNEYLMYNEITDTTYFLQTYLSNNNIIGSTIKSGINNNIIYNDNSNFAEYTIAGVIKDNKEYSLTYYNKETVKDLIKDNLQATNIYTNINTISELEKILEYYPINNGKMLSSTKQSDDLLTSTSFIYFINLVGKYGTIFFLIFACILLMNFISTSIKFRKKEIGILRAIGCRSLDVMKIFLYECIALMTICLTISTSFIPKIINSINEFMHSNFYIDINILKFGISEIVSLVGIIVLISVISNIIPIQKLTKKKPIDVILDK